MNKIIFLLLLGIVLWLIINANSTTEDSDINKINSANQSDLQVTETSPKQSVDSKDTLIHKSQTDITEEIQDNSDTVSADKPHEPELDYISAYREWQYFKNCYTDVEDFKNKKDPLQTLEERFRINNRESQTEPTLQQRSYYQRHVEICKSLIDDESDDYYQIMIKLKQRFEEIQPKTEQEKQLQSAIQMIREYEKYLALYNDSFRPVSSLPDSENNRIQSQISMLNQQLYEVYENSDPISENEIMQIRDLQIQIDDLEDMLEASEFIDNKKVEEAQGNLFQYVNAIDEYLKHVSSPDAFLLLADKIYQIEFVQQQPDVVKELKNVTRIRDSQYINTLNSIVLPLVSCSLNYPCDAESDLMMSYCLGLKDSMFNQACGKSLEDFYFSYYIGSAQLSDVNDYFNFLIRRYAQ